MKSKTSELTGAALDWAVAACITPGKPVNIETFQICRAKGDFRFSTSWDQGGPIAEREKISTLNRPWESDNWHARILKDGAWLRAEGPTPLIAAMRCYVASKLKGPDGLCEEIEIPDELES